MLPFREMLDMLLPPSVYYRRRIAEEVDAGEPELDLLPELVRRGSTAVDVGANQGFFSFALAQHAAQVVAFEPNPDYALSALKAAFDAGAKFLVLCDTNGGTLPEDAYRIVSEAKAKLPNANFGIHAHNDTEQAVAVSLAAVRGGAPGGVPALTVAIVVLGEISADRCAI